MTDERRASALTRLDDMDIAPAERELMVVLVAAGRLRPRARRLEPVTIEQRALAPRRRVRTWRLLAYAALAAAVPAALLGWLVAPFVSGTRPGNKVEVALPSGLDIDLPELPPPSTRPSARPKVAVPIAVPDKERAATSRAPVSGLMTVDRLAEVEAAVRATFSSGVAQPWAAKGLEGYAVAGPIQIEATHVCRNVAIWAKAAGGGDGRTVSTRKCMSKGGAWVDVGKPEMVITPGEPPAPVRTATP